MHIDERIEIIQLTNLADLVGLNGKTQLYMTLSFLLCYLRIGHFTLCINKIESTKRQTSI